jgi:toxin-antitoxin system PIN domain toxin
MIVLDANLLIYAYNTQADQHSAARSWLEARLSEPEPVALPWEAVTAFLRITTQGGPLKAPITMQQAIAIVDSWLEQPQVFLLYPDRATWAELRHLLLKADVSGRGVTDAQFAAATIAHDGTLYSADADFKRFSNLRRLNPLKAQ